MSVSRVPTIAKRIAIEAAVDCAIQEYAASTAAAAMDLVLAGYSKRETLIQFEQLYADIFANLLRAVDECRHA